MSLGENTYPGQVDFLGHEQAEGGHEELPYLAFGGVRPREVDPETLDGEPASVGEGHLGVQLGFPENLQLLPLRIVIEAGKSNQSLVPWLGR